MARDCSMTNAMTACDKHHMTEAHVQRPRRPRPSSGHRSQLPAVMTVLLGCVVGPGYSPWQSGHSGLPPYRVTPGNRDPEVLCTATRTWCRDEETMRHKTGSAAADTTHLRGMTVRSILSWRMLMASFIQPTVKCCYEKVDCKRPNSDSEI